MAVVTPNHRHALAAHERFRALAERSGGFIHHLGKRVALMLRPNDGAPIDFARVHQRDFAGVDGGLDFIVGE